MTPTVCQVLHSLGIGGAEVLAAEIARRLSGRYRFVFACLDSLGTLGEQLVRDGFRVEVLNRQPGLDWRCAFRLAKFQREEHVAVTHAHQYTPFFQAVLGRLSYRKPPIVFTEHGRHYPDSRSSKRVLFNRSLIRGDDRFFGVGQAVCEALITNEGLPEDRVECIFNGVNLAPFAAVANDEVLRADVRRELGLDAAEFVVLQVARLNPLKDHLTALRALERLTLRGMKARLVLAGDGEERTKIEDFIRSHGLGDRVLLLGARRDVPRLMAAADVFLLSSISEGIPLTFIEAMAAELPIVATDVGGCSEVVKHNATGLLAPAEDDASLAIHLETLQRDSLKRREFGLAGSRRAFESFSLDRMLDEYAAVYEAMTSQSRMQAQRAEIRKPRSLGRGSELNGRQSEWSEPIRMEPAQSSIERLPNRAPLGLSRNGPLSPVLTDWAFEFRPFGA